MLLCSSAFSQQTVYYPRSESSGDARQLYPIELLKLCLQKTNAPYQLEPSVVTMQQGRSLRLLKAGNSVDIVWTVTSQEREAELLPIRIPIDRGLLGWRLLLIRAVSSERFANINTAQQLMPLRAGQGHDWPDFKVLNENHFNVTPSATYEGLFNMLARDHIDYFPRSISEARQEILSHTTLELSIESHLLIHYPAALYYFVNKDNQALAQTIENGLQLAIDDGSLVKLFNQYYAKDIEQASLSKRTLLELKNPSLPVATPLEDKRYWFTPEGDAK